jgi:O-acetyl-ADP-ribose deacetylase (regulator of RNase III)
MINYVTGDATDPIGDGPKLIAHVCNNSGGWGRGFVVAISKRWREPELAYRDLASCGALVLGEIQVVSVAADIGVANMVAQDGYGDDGKPPIRYPALTRCLSILADRALNCGASVHMPRIGCGLAGGRWETVEWIIERELCRHGIDVTVYDLP